MQKYGVQKYGRGDVSKPAYWMVAHSGGVYSFKVPKTLSEAVQFILARYSRINFMAACVSAEESDRIGERLANGTSDEEDARLHDWLVKKRMIVRLVKIEQPHDGQNKAMNFSRGPA